MIARARHQALIAWATLLLLATWPTAPPPPLAIRAEWRDIRTARLRWTQPATEYLCVARVAPYTLLGCGWANAGAVEVRLPPSPPSDGAYWPTPGAVYVVTGAQGEERGRATLPAWRVFAPLVAG